MDNTLEHSPVKKSSFAKELLHFALIIIFIVLPIRLFVAQPFVVVGSSMEPTFFSNDYLIVDEISYRINKPKRGDVMVFKHHSGYEQAGGIPQDESVSKYFIKRAIGLPGETVDIREGVVTIFNDEHPEGFVLNEEYIKDIPDNIQSTTLGEDQYFVMGDNRDVSFDSRSWGPLNEKEIVGKAFLRLLPLNRADILPGSFVGKYTNEYN